MGGYWSRNTQLLLPSMGAALKQVPNADSPSSQLALWGSAPQRSVSVIHCCRTNAPETQWLKAAEPYNCIVLVGQEGRQGFPGWSWCRPCSLRAPWPGPQSEGLIAAGGSAPTPPPMALGWKPQSLTACASPQHSSLSPRRPWWVTQACRDQDGGPSAFCELVSEGTRCPRGTFAFLSLLEVAPWALPTPEGRRARPHDVRCSLCHVSVLLYRGSTIAFAVNEPSPRVRCEEPSPRTAGSSPADSTHRNDPFPTLAIGQALNIPFKKTLCLSRWQCFFVYFIHEAHYDSASRRSGSLSGPVWEPGLYSAIQPSVTGPGTGDEPGNPGRQGPNTNTVPALQAPVLWRQWMS